MDVHLSMFLTSQDKEGMSGRLPAVDALLPWKDSLLYFGSWIHYTWISVWSVYSIVCTAVHMMHSGGAEFESRLRSHNYCDWSVRFSRSMVPTCSWL